jgi:hypothetical protein
MHADITPLWCKFNTIMVSIRVQESSIPPLKPFWFSLNHETGLSFVLPRFLGKTACAAWPRDQ